MITLVVGGVGVSPPHPPSPLLGLDAQLVGDGHDHFEDGHEGGALAEVAVADHLGVDLQTPLVVLARHTGADLVEPGQDVVRELRDRQGDITTCYHGPPEVRPS